MNTAIAVASGTCAPAAREKRVNRSVTAGSAAVVGIEAARLVLAGGLEAAAQHLRADERELGFRLAARLCHLARALELVWRDDLEYAGAGVAREHAVLAAGGELLDLVARPAVAGIEDALQRLRGNELELDLLDAADPDALASRVLGHARRALNADG